MSRTIALAAFAAVLAATAGSFVVLPSGKTRAADKDATFLIPAAEGYGVADCLTGGSSECGRIVADAYCEAQGFAKAECATAAPRPRTSPARSTRRWFAPRASGRSASPARTEPFDRPERRPSSRPIRRLPVAAR